MIRRGLLMLVFALAAGLLLNGKAFAQDAPVLLVAAPDLQGPYAGTVVHAIPFHGGHIGLILNRHTEAAMASVFPDHQPSAKVTAPIFIGGTDFMNTVFAVARAAAARDVTSIPLMPGVWLERTERVIDSIIEKTPNEARYFVGLVLWKPGLLESEISRGIWIVRKPDASLFFADPKGIYQKLQPLQKGQVQS